MVFYAMPDNVNFYKKLPFTNKYGFSKSIVCLNHRNIKTQGITMGETSFIKLNGFY